MKVERIFRVIIVVFLFTILFSLTSCEKGSEGLQYYFRESGKFYEVVGIGECKDKNIVIPGKYEGYPVLTIAEEAFRECNTITSIKISEGIRYIKERAFRECKNLVEVKMADSITTIGEGAFAACDKLKK